MAKWFTADLREAVRLAQEQARQLGHAYIGIEQLLLGLTGLRRGAAAELLRERGLDGEALRRVLLRLLGTDLDGEDLAAVGVDLEQIRRAADEQFGPEALEPTAQPVRPGHLPPTRRAKTVLARARRHAWRHRDGQVDVDDVLLALVQERHGLAARMLTALGLDLDDLAAGLRARRLDAA